MYGPYELKSLIDQRQEEILQEAHSRRLAKQATGASREPRFFGSRVERTRSVNRPTPASLLLVVPAFVAILLVTLAFVAINLSAAGTTWDKTYQPVQDTTPMTAGRHPR